MEQRHRDNINRQQRRARNHERELQVERRRYLQPMQQQQIDNAFNLTASRFRNIATRLDLQHDPVAFPDLAFPLFGASELPPEVNHLCDDGRLFAALSVDFPDGRIS